jgi:hypothetical protein
LCTVTCSYILGMCSIIIVLNEGSRVDIPHRNVEKKKAQKFCLVIFAVIT